MPTKGYQTYHGRTPRWKKVIMILLVIILIAACGVLLLQKYQVFDGNGVHLALPGKEETSSAEPEGGEQSQQPGEVIIDEPEQRTAVLRGRSFDAAALQNETFAALQEALEQQNTETAFRAAHTLKGVAVNLGFTRLYHAAAALTEVLRAAKLAEAAPLLAETETAYRKIINAISALTSD